MFSVKRLVRRDGKVIGIFINLYWFPLTSYLTHQLDVWNPKRTKDSMTKRINFKWYQISNTLTDRMFPELKLKPDDTTWVLQNKLHSVDTSIL